MSMVLRKRTWRGALAILCGLCIAAGITAATTSGAAKKFAVDHQLCYTAAGKFAPPSGSKVTLFNQFSPNGFNPLLRPALALHCNPVLKIVKDATGAQHAFKPTNPRAHLACLPFTLPAGTTVPAPKVLVTNQFGSATLYLKQPNLFCLPSWKSMTGPPKLKPNQPPGLNHFTCYPVVDTAGSYKIPPVVMLKDQFATKPVQTQVNAVPDELCLPTKKVITTAAGAKRGYPILDAATHLLCFGGVKTPTKPKVWDENQFGTSVVKIRIAKWLCLPSTKEVLPS